MIFLCIAARAHISKDYETDLPLFGVIVVDCAIIGNLIAAFQ